MFSYVKQLTLHDVKTTRLRKSKEEANQSLRQEKKNKKRMTDVEAIKKAVLQAATEAAKASVLVIKEVSKKWNTCHQVLESPIQENQQDQ